jgi:DNA-binding response OmpR family regulator
VHAGLRGLINAGVRILVVEDEPKIGAFLKRGLQAEGFSVAVSNDGEQGLARALTDDIDLVILDLILPGLSGEQVLTRLRHERRSLPVIVLTAKDAISDRVTNLEAGADDYLTKPFSFSELLARIRARLRTAQSASAVELEVGPLRLDVRLREVRVEGRRAELTPREFALLETFMRHPGQVLSQAQLLDQVWGYDHDPGSNIAEVYVGYLRRKLRPDLIETVRGVGYRLRA